MDREDKAKQFVMDIQGTFGTEEGKRTLAALSDKCREHVATYVAQDTHHTAYFEGMRSVIIYIRMMLAKDLYKEKQAKAQEKE